MAEYLCTKCGYIYNEAYGDEEHGVKKGTLFADLPDNWVCPRCKAEKWLFKKREE